MSEKNSYKIDQIVNSIFEGDCIEIMKQFPDNCIETKCLVFEKITLFWATLCGYNLYSRLKAVTLRQTQQII